MAQGIIDFFEAIQIHHEHSEGSFEAPDAFQSDIQTVVEQGAIGQVGERIMFGHVTEAFFIAANDLGLLPDAAAQQDDPKDR